MNVVELPVGNLMDIASMFRRVADQMDSGELPVPETVLFINVLPCSCITFHCFGRNPPDFEAVGILEMAKHEYLSTRKAMIADCPHR